MKDASKIFLGFSVGVILTWVLSAGTQFDLVKSILPKADTVTTVDTVEGPVQEKVKYQYRDKVILKTDSFVSADTVYVTSDSSLVDAADSTRTYSITGGDSVVKFRQNLEVAGKLLSQEYTLDYKLPTKVIERTQTREIRRTDVVRHYTHNVYVSAATNQSVGLHYNWKAVFVGYEYGWQDQSHTIRGGVNLSHIFHRLFKQ